MRELLENGPPKSRLKLVLAHGAGAPMDSPFMNRIAEGVGAAGIGVVRFEFPFMNARRHSHKRGAPDREPALRQTWMEVIAQLGGGAHLVIGGKSMGGRIASMLADGAGAAGLVCLGYPFHPPGRPQRLRVDHLRELRTPALIVQGARDTMGNREEVGGYQLSPRIRLEWIDDGDHSFTPPRRSSRTADQNLSDAINLVTGFIFGLE